ncbi:MULTISPECIES: hypothetical protein [unclassified Mesorhizobium]|uniref:hypothetical protein n=1 Tax=unclassified Mesorhizobium TaxID=325217 RepID=UPI000F75232D|nr:MULTISPECIES: hypothetical protein [unclassified Mesorhizobium]AZO05026.1 hypothetical protein EJ068_19510 [Mesorhizobium sp. M2A.F.Ca.ET.043.02.1.1]RWB37564.1 MAG: hypothetical protein EOQ46_31610 [Mesorhizobium sp.]RWB52989.1 MAG: hypothetical protein EOQ48_33805 [Mesorhizobium sp.]RWB80040.1 MAG: hypothetical protein EOQ51_31650 [Mesorhizobium sp.]RWC11709.1 MAG: hypothetical protein EOS52_20980 [Mesorhizobium sp.]
MSDGGEAVEEPQPITPVNKGEAAHKLKRAAFLHVREEIRDRSLESQHSALPASTLSPAPSYILEYGLPAHFAKAGQWFR